MQAKIFISYRRNDNIWAVEMIFASLSNFFNSENIFKDNFIAGGEEFERKIEKEIDSCNIFLLIIGRNWIEELKKRIEKKDHVLQEIVWAISKNKKIFPVLLDSAKMPNLEDIPNEIIDFNKFNAIEINLNTFQLDLKTLSDSIEKFLLENQDIKRVLILDDDYKRAGVLFGLLKKLEQEIRTKNETSEARISDQFELIIGNGAISIVAIFLSLGMSVDEIENTYLNLIENIKEGSTLGFLLEIISLNRLFKRKNNNQIDIKLRKIILQYFDDKTIKSDLFKTSFCVFLYNFDSGRTEPFTNVYLDGNINSNIKIIDLLFASYSNPYLTKNQPYQFYVNDKIGSFITGSFGATKNPSLNSLIFINSIYKKIGWKLNEDNLIFISIGSGYSKLLPENKYKNIIQWINLMPYLLSQNTIQSNEIIIERFTKTNNLNKVIDLNIFEKTLNKEQKIISYFRVDTLLPDEEFNPNNKSKTDFHQLKSVVLKNNEILFSKEIMQMLTRIK